MSLDPVMLVRRITLWAMVLTAVLSSTVVRAENPPADTSQATTAMNAPATQSVQAHKPGPVTTDDELIAAFDLTAPGMGGVKAAVGAHDLTAIKTEYLKYRRTACPAVYTVMPSDQPKEAVEQSDEIGDEICRHYIRNLFYKLGLPGGDMGKDFNWTFNPAPRSSPDYSDQWTYCVISRTQFWETLADAYWKSRNEKYAAEWVAQLLDFAAKNRADAKPKPGVPSLWMALDCGRVGDSWPYAYYHFLNSPAFTPEAQWTYTKLVLDHVPVLKSVLESPYHNGNHAAIECNGLFAIGMLFPELHEAAAWRDFTVARISREMDKTVEPDGFETELTPWYHYGEARSFSGPVKLARLNHLPLPDALTAKLLAMYRAPIMVMDQSGETVSTNDAEHINAGILAKEGMALLGDDPLLRWAASKGKEGAGLPASTMLPYAGFYAMRGGWKPDDMFLFFRGGPAGTGHQHEDMLEIVLRAWNKTLLFDPGSYNYDSSDWRRYVVGTPAHNTIIVDGKWQHRGANRPPVTQPVQNPWVTTPMFDYVAATYDKGYQQNEWNPKAQYMPFKWVGEVDRSVSHTRRVLYLRPGYALVLDTVDGTGEHTVDAHFHMDAPAARLDTSTQAAFSVPGPKADEAQLALFPLDRTNLVTEIVQGQLDPILGWMPVEHRPIPTVRFRKHQTAPFIFATVLYPYRGEAPQVSSVPIQCNDTGVWAQSLQTPQEQAEIILAKDNLAHEVALDSPQLGELQTQAAGLVVRKSGAADANATWVGGWALSSCRCPLWDLSWSSPAQVVWQRQGNKILAYNAGLEPCDMTIAQPFQLKATLPSSVWVEVSKDGVIPMATPPQCF
jgi:Heparinase II/III N-terminus/Heparinase II/III-like protein